MGSVAPRKTEKQMKVWQVDGVQEPVGGGGHRSGKKGDL